MTTTDTDRMGDLQAAAHGLREIAHTHPGTPPPPIAEHAENLRSYRTIAVSLAALLSQTAEQLAHADGYVSRVKNPVDAQNQVGAARAVAANVAGALNSVAGALQAAEVALSRIEPAPPEETPVDVTRIVADHLESDPRVREALGGPGRIHVHGEPTPAPEVDLFAELDKMSVGDDDDD